MRSSMKVRVFFLAILLRLLGGVVLRRAGQEPEYKTVKGKSKPKYEESVFEEYRVETKRGSIYGVVQRPVVRRRSRFR